MFIVIELQTINGQTANIVTTKDTEEKAMSAYHSILAAAAVSSVEYHTALVVDPKGQYLAKECYHHPQPEPEEVIE
ncbi:MAG: hypothetical protein IKE74_03295 [Mogibacterium sp.]|nr:hypothetical protein [Mogibacterium sp.]